MIPGVLESERLRFMSALAVERCLEILQAAAAAFLAARLFHFGLHRKMRAILAFVLLTGILSGFAALSPPSFSFYFYFYVCSLPVVALVNMLATRELADLVFRKYPGIKTVVRWMTYSAVGLAITVSLMIAKVFWVNDSVSRTKLVYLMVAQRSLVLSLAVCILGVGFCLSRYPLHLPGNLMLSSVLFSVTFLSEALVLLIDSLSPTLTNPYLDLSMIAVVATCLTVWGSLLRDEPVPVVNEHMWTSEKESALLHQLDTLNEVMGRAARR